MTVGNIVYLVGGLLIGASGMYAYMRYREDKQLREEMNAAREYYKNINASKAKNSYEYSGHENNDGDLIDAYIPSYNEDEAEESDAPIFEEEDDLDDDEDEHLQAPNELGISAAKLITKEQFGEPGWGFDVIELRYFDEDEGLCDSNDMLIMHNIFELVGDYQSHWHHEEGIGDVVYIRNFGKAADIKITKINDSFKRSVLGFDWHKEDDGMRALNEDE